MYHPTVRTLIVIALLLVIPGAAFAQTFTPVTTGSPVTEAGAWRSVNWIDYDRDGFLDLFVTRGKAGGQDNVLFRNNGSPPFAFTKMGSLIISQDHKPSDGSTWADIDNDGDLDCFVANWYNENNLLYLNNGDGTFTQITSGAPVTDHGYSETGSWGDYNNDGLVDLYVGNSSGSRLNFLYKNLGNGQFQRITAGIAATDAQNTRGVTWVDYDADGDLDLLAVNESGQNENLYRNMRSETGIDTLTRVTGDPIVSDSGNTWNGSWGDYDNDGDLDVFFANSGGQVNSLFRNNGNGSFTKVLTGSIPTDTGWWATAAWGDFDNDGDLDLVATQAYSGSPSVNALYKNLLIETGIPELQRVVVGPVVTDPGYSYGVSWGDYDEDGDLDLFFARTFNENQVNAFYRNDGNANHWLTVECRGVASNAAAIGATIVVSATINGVPVTQRRLIEGQHGYCGENLLAHFGLGDAVVIDSLRIEWPSGNRETYSGAPVNRHFVIVERDSTPNAAVAPANGSTNSASQLSVKWRRSLYFPPYRIQFAADSSFTAPIIDTVTGPDTTFNLRVRDNHLRYFWRVRSARSIHESSWSAVRYFDNDITLPPPPNLLAPAGGVANLPLSVSLRWGSSPNATGYHFRIANDSLFASAVVDTHQVDTSKLVGGLIYFHKYYWKVNGENVAGEGITSETRTFTTIIEAPAAPVTLGPQDGAVDQPGTSIFAWSTGLRAERYQLQISSDTLFQDFLVNDTTITDTASSVGGLGSLRLWNWRVRSINAGGASTFSQRSSFRTLLGTPTLLVPADRAATGTHVTTRWMSVESAENYRVQLSEDSTFSGALVADSLVADTSFPVSALFPEMTYHWRVRAVHPQSTSAWSEVRSFRTALQLYTIRPRTSWSLVSVPAVVADLRAGSVFGTAQSGLFQYSGLYSRAETLRYGKGYWGRFTPMQDVSVAGVELLSDTVDVVEGWNLVGSVSVPVLTAHVGSIPPAVVTSPFFGFEGSYRAVDTLFPAHGYWVKANQDARIILAGESMANSAASRIRISAGELSPPPPPDVAEGKGEEDIPDGFVLEQNHPNPFNPTSRIRFSVPFESMTTLTVTDALGREVARPIDNAYLTTGKKEIIFDGAALPSGIYYYTLLTRGYRETKKMLLLK